MFYVFVSAAVIQLFYFIFIFRKVSFRGIDKNKPLTKESVPVSVVICAKNEAQNLKNNLPHILNQNYKLFEVVLINDASSDETLDVMEEFAALNSNVKVVNVSNNETFWGNKKYALTLGIKATTNDYLLFTDADCKPSSANWIIEMVNCFSADKTIILGYSPYERIKNSLVNMLVRFETMLTGLQYLSYADIGIPYMGVGRNLAYHKSEFFKAKGFINHMKLLSGDDDLFVNQAATKGNATICTNPESFMISVPKRTFKDWFKQKRRHVSTASYYKLSHKLLLGTYYLSKLLFWFTLILLLAFFVKPVWTISIAVALIFIKIIFYKQAFKILGDISIWWLTPILEVFLITIQFAIFITNSLSKPTHWK
ncbi:glycosyltransferase [Ascidiimonas sp. W6]|uniref:glycosyltransferase n=1 Tax=Ascidiimonas meishanensis TaxID=3128903 RepID=UPI0030EDFD3A